MAEIKKILIVGCGGIGSFLIEHIYKLIMNDQIPIDLEFELVDFDKVELKNLKYQNFTDKDIMKNKALALADRFKFIGEDKKIENDADLKEYDTFILAVDNPKVRKLVYEHCFINKKFFIDLRAEGRQFAVITADLDELDALLTLPKAITDEGGSCQLKYEFDNNILQLGNQIVALMGAQTLLNKIRGQPYNPKIIMRV